MNIEIMSDRDIAEEFGARIEQLRLEKNLTQQELAESIGLSRVSYGKLVRGSGKFVNVIAVLRALGYLDMLLEFIHTEDDDDSEGGSEGRRQRMRASGRRSAGNE